MKGALLSNARVNRSSCSGGVIPERTLGSTTHAMIPVGMGSDSTLLGVRERAWGLFGIGTKCPGGVREVRATRVNSSRL